MVNFSMLPPEINSARLFSGAGSAPMMAAATAWNGLADELSAAASSFASVTSGLADQAWQGPAAQAMAAAAAPYTGWLNAAAARATGAAGQAQAVIDAFEAARAATIHPLMVEANRNGLVQLVMSNFFGQNWPAISAMEADYEAMWAQDVEAMLGYHAGVSSAAAQLAPWQQSLRNVATQIAGALGLSPIANPVPGDPFFETQTQNIGPFTITAIGDSADNNFVAVKISSPFFTDTLTSGFEPATGMGMPGQTINNFQSPVLPFLNSGIALPITDPLAPLFIALLPLGF
jgi:PPE-repeat protein